MLDGGQWRVVTLDPFFLKGENRKSMAEIFFLVRVA